MDMVYWEKHVFASLQKVWGTITLHKNTHQNLRKPLVVSELGWKRTSSRVVAGVECGTIWTLSKVMIWTSISDISTCETCSCDGHKRKIVESIFIYFFIFVEMKCTFNVTIFKSMLWFKDKMKRCITTDGKDRFEYVCH